MRNKKARNIEYKVLLMEWEESERGWGVRDDGASIHKDRETYDKYLRDYWAGMPREVPDEYSRPVANNPIEIFVDKKTFDEVQKSGSVRLFGSYMERRKAWRKAV